MRQRGLNLAPWVHPTPPRAVTADNGVKVWLALEEDPLEVLLMGARFNTCLSPGHCNFFSTFANVADANKHVLYARDKQGRVLGRRLLALTESGSLLAFSVYCHDGALNLDKLTDAWVAELAEQMNTVIARRGDVPRLVATDWYDDGPCDVAGRFAFLERGSEFRKSLASIQPGNLVRALEDAFAPLPLNAMTLGLVIELPELHSRPVLIGELLPVLQSCDDLPPATLFQAAKLAWQAAKDRSTLAPPDGAEPSSLENACDALAEFARRVFREQVAPHLLRGARPEGHFDYDLVEGLIDHDPSAALRVLRQSRPRAVRADEEERAYDSHRRRLLALAHRRLGREALARRIYPYL
jgi:hypothetical protein